MENVKITSIFDRNHNNQIAQFLHAHNVIAETTDLPNAIENLLIR